MQKLLLGKDINGNVSYSIPFPDPNDLTNNFLVNLAANTEETVVAPTYSTAVLISASPGSSILVGIGTNALPSIGGTFATGNGQINPILRNVNAGDTVRVKNLTTDPALINLTFYQQ